MKIWSRKIGWIGLLICGLLLIRCDEGVSNGSLTVTQDSREPIVVQSGVSVMRVAGVVTVQKAGSSTQTELLPGMHLNTDDTLMLTQGSTAALNCLDGTTWYVPYLNYTFLSSDCPPARNDLNMIVVNGGDVQLRISGTSNFTPAANNTFARRGDEIIVASSADAHILCGSDTEWHDIPRDQPVDIASGCPLSNECLLCKKHPNATVNRAGLDPLIPYLITPRSTNLLTPTPLLHWNPVADAVEYTVSIVGGDMNWETTTTDTQLRYPGTPAIKSGEVYLLKVVADNGRSSDEEGTPRLGFVRLDEPDANTIRAQLDNAATLDLPADSLAIYQSILYANANLIAEAITLLEATAQTSAHVRIYYELGELYRQIGLPLEAREAYAAALALDNGDVRTIAATHDGLGKTYLMLGRIEDAGEAFKEAQNQYTEAQEFGLAAAAETQWRELEE